MLRVGLGTVGGFFGVAARWAAASLRSTEVFLLHCGRMRRAVLWGIFRCRLAACWFTGLAPTKAENCLGGVCALAGLEVGRA